MGKSSPSMDRLGARRFPGAVPACTVARLQRDAGAEPDGGPDEEGPALDERRLADGGSARCR